MAAGLVILLAEKTQQPKQFLQDGNQVIIGTVAVARPQLARDGNETISIEVFERHGDNAGLSSKQSLFIVFQVCPRSLCCKLCRSCGGLVHLLENSVSHFS